VFHSEDGKAAVNEKSLYHKSSIKSKKSIPSDEIDMFEKNSPYLVIPVTSQPDIDGKFTLSTLEGRFEKAPDVSVLEIEGSWDANGGKDKIQDNPQFIINVTDDDVSAAFVLSPEAETASEIGFYVVSLDSDEPEFISEKPLSKRIIENGPWSSNSESELCCNLSPGFYSVIPCTSKGGESNSNFKITIYSNVKIEKVELKKKTKKKKEEPKVTDESVALIDYQNKKVIEYLNEIVNLKKNA